jgi:hypothetical protein
LFVTCDSGMCDTNITTCHAQRNPPKMQCERDDCGYLLEPF